jgi:hypothetical protein
MKTLEIFFDDLNEEAQARALEAFSVELSDEMNWDTAPIFVIDVEEDDENN